MKFSKWIELREARSQKSLSKCPHPDNKEYCKEYKRFLNGEINTPPDINDFESRRPAFGHDQSMRSRAGTSPTRRNVMRRKAAEGTGRYKDSWKRDQ